MKNTDSNRLVYALGDDIMMNMEMLRVIDTKMDFLGAYILVFIASKNPTLDYFAPEKVVEEEFKDSLEAYNRVLGELMDKGVVKREGENLVIVEEKLIELTTEAA